MSKINVIFHHAFSRKEIKDKASNYNDLILIHLCKLFLDKDSLDRNHWIGEIQGWIRSLDKLTCKTTKPSLSELVMIDVNPLKEHNYFYALDELNILNNPKYNKEELASEFVSRTNKFLSELKDHMTKDQLYELINKYF